VAACRGALVAIATVLAAAAPPAPSVLPVPSDVLPVGRELRVVASGGRDLILEIKPWPNETLAALARRISPSRAQGEQLTAFLSDPNVRTVEGYYRIPLALLGADARAFVLRSAFPEDRADGGDWLHIARKSPLPIYDEGLWQVAAWFTGDGANFAELQRVNGLSSPELSPGQIVRVPANLLDAALKPGPTSDDGTLVYGSDARGPFAGYRLKPGEALYSAVVLRYTGRTAPEDVEALARTIATRSDVRDVTGIPAGWLVKIPIDVLEPEFLPKSDARRKSIDTAKAAMERELTAHPPKEAPRGLAGVVVIIDPGHGGMDPGTMNHSVWEHDYVFDVASRLRRELSQHTAAKVFLTLDGPSKDAVPSVGDALQANRKRSILTSPPFLAEEDGETAVAVNLRWYLANSLYRKLVKGGTDPDKIVFLSLHADARHPSLRGAMVYVPGAAFRTGTMGYSSTTYLRFKEVREQPRVSFTSRDRLRSEAVSRKLANAIVKALKRGDLPTQPYQPVRERIIRGREVWLPAVLRGNVVPTKVLIEMCNLNNPDDAALLGRAADRDRLARAFVTALSDYFAPKGSPRGRGR
jgi:N-acetylmuramoyl-L-alanine amidase